MSQTIKIQIQPQLLQWAREEAGYKAEEIALKLHITPERYSNWEINGKEIPLGMLKSISNYYKRQLAVFLLPAPPPKLKKPKDFRNLSVSHASLTPDTLLSMRRANKYLELAKDILGDQFWTNQYRWQIEIEKLLNNGTKLNDENITLWLREKLKISIDQQQKFKGYDDAFKHWRNKIEQELGIFVFQFSMPEKELDGFCYASENPPYAIVINSSSDPKNPKKIFTLFHELAHILKHQSSICLSEITDEKQNIEFEYNDFAGKFLIPDAYVYPIENIKDLGKIARLFKVSREVYLRRNFEREFINKKDFFGILKELKLQTPVKKKEKLSGAPPPPVLSKNLRGEKFYNLILNAVYNDKIDYTTASDALGMGFNYIAHNE